MKDTVPQSSGSLDLQNVIETIPALVVCALSDGAVEFVNRAWQEYTGYSPKKLNDSGWRSIIHADDLPRFVDEWNIALSAGRSFETEARIKRSDGQYRWFLIKKALAVLGTRDRQPSLRTLIAFEDIDARKQSQIKLQQSEARYRLLIETASDAVISADESGTITFANPSAMSIFGYAPNDLIGKPLTILMPEFLRSAYQEGLRRYASTGERQFNWHGTELVGLRNNREEFPIAVSLGELISDGKRVFTAFIRDISEQKRAQESLRRTHSYLAQAERLARIGTFAWEAPGRKPLYLSEEWYRIYGFDPKEGMPTWKQFMERIHPEDRIRLEATSDRAIAEKSDYDVEFRILIPRALIKFVRTVGEPVLGPSGELLQFVGVSMDVTESRQAEEAFRLIVMGTAATTGSDFFQSLVQHMAQALRARYAFVTTCDDRKHARTLAFWQGDRFGENFDFDIADTPCEKVLHGEVCHYRQELQDLFPRDKVLADWKAESYLGLPMLDRSNRVIGHIAILDDKPMDADMRAVDLLKIFASRAAAELKRQKAEDKLQAALQERERLRRAQAELAHINRVSTMGELTASLAHEIKQPIGAAVTNAEACMRLLDRDQPDVPEAREAAFEMVKDARRAADIIDRVRMLYQKGSSQPDVVDVNQVIREMVIMLQNEANRHSITICTDFAEGLPKVMADRVQLQQVLMNLMLNGMEAMRGRSGELGMKSQLADDGQILISVTDTGVGLPAENAEQIFNPFFTTKPQGTGLGLVITRSIVEAHGGRIWATANSGPGATFQFTLPIRAAIAA
jgi:PAS domain S-box-containing protein